MEKIDLQTMEEPLREPVSTERPARLFFIDHLRAALVILVVIHHIAMVYGGIQPFYYLELDPAPPFVDPLAFTAALVFVLFNQAWFMGAFFLLTGYFTPGSYDRKGPATFLKERLLRLGIPLILFVFVLNPIASIGFYQMPPGLTGITTPLTWATYPHLIGLGPLWFVAMLLIFNFGYVAWRWLTRKRVSSVLGRPSRPSYFLIGGFVLALALTSFLIRLIIPLGESVSLFVDALSFPTLAYLPQYLSFFILGMVAYHHDWFRKLPGAMGIVGFVMALGAGVLLFPLAFSGQLFSLAVTEQIVNAYGNGHWQSAVYALWDSIFAVGICLGLIPLFRRFFNAQSGFGTFLSRHSYAVYVFHVPILVLLALALRGVDLGNIPKFVLAVVIIVPICFAAAYVIRKLPMGARIL